MAAWPKSKPEAFNVLAVAKMTEGQERQCQLFKIVWTNSRKAMPPDDLLDQFLAESPRQWA
jgi:hypothetical protein